MFHPTTCFYLYKCFLFAYFRAVLPNVRYFVFSEAVISIVMRILLAARESYTNYVTMAYIFCPNPRYS